ncbi:MAG: hypothetical protein H6835_02310 [Planctomycetes bacterium]|nr:hypothetical protein [Planctomycetota bacterium]
MFSTRRLVLLWPLLGLCALPAQRTPDEAQRALQEGNERFASGHSAPQPVGEGVRRTLARGQSPFAVIVTCSDSRVPPEHVFNTGLGELIVVRTAGHVVSPETVAAIEQAVEQLEVPLCVVLGHEHCDVVAAAVAQLSGNQGERELHRSQAMLQLFERIEPALRKARALDLGGGELLRACEEEHAQLTTHECLRRSELLRRYASVGRFRIVPARYHADGAVEWLPPRPLPVEPDAARAIPPGAIPMGLPPHVALRMLRAGHRRFLGDARPQPDLTAARRAQLAEGEQPIAVVLTDTDSRIAPEHVFDAGLGELYVVRTSGNVLTDESLASIEFAASELGASLLVVMGHNRCAPVAAATRQPEHQQMTPNQRQLLRLLEPSVMGAHGGNPAELAEDAGRRNVQRAVNEARSRSALLRSLEQQGRFAVLPVFYDVASGDLEWLKDGAPEQAVAARSSSQHDSAPRTSARHETGHAASGHDDRAATGSEHQPAATHGEHDQDATHGTADHGATAVAQHGHDSDHGAANDREGSADHQAEPHGATNHGDDHSAAGHDALPVLDWAQLAAPMGETAPGSHSPNANAQHHGDEHEGADDHGAQGTEHDAAGHDDSSHPSTEHQATDHQSTGHEDPEHGAEQGSGRHGEEGHGDHAEHAPTGQGASTLSSRWSDPVVVVGLGGIASLLVAALLALKTR